VPYPRYFNNKGLVRGLIIFVAAVWLCLQQAGKGGLGFISLWYLNTVVSSVSRYVLFHCCFPASHPII
jgi:hypothetical protein